MRGMLAIFLFIGLAAFCWGGYGPVLKKGQDNMAEVADGKPVRRVPGGRLPAWAWLTS